MLYYRLRFVWNHKFHLCEISKFDISMVHEIRFNTINSRVVNIFRTILYEFKSIYSIESETTIDE